MSIHWRAKDMLCSIILIGIVAIQTHAALSVRNDSEFEQVHLNKRIINGVVIEKCDHPWMVELFYDGDIRCSGIFLKDDWVMTAAHCLVGPLSEPPLQTEKFKIHMTLTKQASFWRSIWHVARTAGRWLYEYDPTTIYIHPDYRKGVNFNDIALIKLSDRPEMPPTTTGWPGLPGRDRDWPTSAETCTAYGSGLIHVDDDDIVGPRKLSMPVHSVDQCLTFLSPSSNFRKIICAGPIEQNQGVTDGDSGGPLVCLDGENEPKLAGILAVRREDLFQPAIFTRVTYFPDWIYESMRIPVPT